MKPKHFGLDEFLAHFGLFRKPMAKDETSLYRAVSEQLFMCQVKHVEIKERCERYMEQHKEEMSSKLTQRLEFGAISFLYNCDIIVFQFHKYPVNITQNNFKTQVLICVSGADHYDAVYSLQFKTNAAICQSVLYEILYENVFGVSRDTIEEGLEILHTKQSKKHVHINSIGNNDGCKEKTFSSSTESTGSTSGNDKNNNLPLRPPFPYRVAKALDPLIYRNVEYDCWVDAVKEETDGQPTFRRGDRCEVILNETSYHAHIQDVSPNKGPVNVFIEGMGEKLAVPYDSLKAIPQPVTEKKIRSRRRSLSFSNQPRYTEPFTRSSPSPSGFQRTFLNSMGVPIRSKWISSEKPCDTNYMRPDSRPRYRSFSEQSSTNFQNLVAEPEVKPYTFIPDPTQVVQLPITPPLENFVGTPIDSGAVSGIYFPPIYQPCIVTAPTPPPAQNTSYYYSEPPLMAEIQPQASSNFSPGACNNLCVDFIDPIQYYSGVNIQQQQQQQQQCPQMYPLTSSVQYTEQPTGDYTLLPYSYTAGSPAMNMNPQSQYVVPCNMPMPVYDPHAVNSNISSQQMCYLAPLQPPPQ